MLQSLKNAVAPLGITDVEVDHEWQLRQAAETVMGARVLGLGEMPYHFYPIMLRWRRRDGERRLAWIKPVIDRTGERPRLDNFAMAQCFFDMMRADA